MDSIINNLIGCIEEFNVEESIYWAHLLKQKQKHLMLDSGERFVIPLNDLFKGFQLSNEELSSLLSSLIWDSVKDEDFPVIYEKYSNEIFSGLSDEFYDENVKKLCLRIIFELGMQEGHQIDLETLITAFKLINSSKYSISSYLISHLKRNLHLIMSNEEIYKELMNLYSKIRNDSVVQFRFFELFLDQKVISSVIFDELADILNNSQRDILMAANGLQIIQDCIDRREQFELFLKHGIIEKIISKLFNSEGEATVIKCKSMDLLAHCALSKCFDFDFIESNGLDRKLISISFESGIEEEKVSSIFALFTFATLPSESSLRLLSGFEDFLYYGTTSIQLATLHGIGIYFSCASNPQNYLQQLNYKKFFDVLMEKINSTFDEQKSAAYFTLKSLISSSKEVFKFLLDNSTLFSVILQRNLDDSPIGLKWKYGILEDIFMKSDLFDCLNDPLKEQVKKYLGQGITFVPKSSRVAFESQS